MIQLRKTLPALALAILALTATPSEPRTWGRKPDTRVYYYNMGATACFQTLDAKRIEECFDLTSVLRREIAGILKEINDKKVPGKEFDAGEIRLKIVPPDGDTIMCDIYCRVLIGKKRYTLTRDTYNRIHRMITAGLPDG